MTFAKSMKTLSLACAAVATLGLGMGNAMADQMFDFNYTDGANSGNGTFTTGDVGSPFSLTAITGTANGTSITGLSPYASANNLLYYADPVNPRYVDFSGIAFTTAGGPAFNIFDNGGFYGLINSTDNPSGYANPHTDIAFSVTAVPEPASVALLGLGLLGFAASRRKSVK